MSYSSLSDREKSPLSPTIIHYRQKYQISKDYYHRRKQREIRRSSFRYYNQKINNIWQVHRSSTGQIYYYNTVTDQSQWEKPSKEQFSRSITKKSVNKHKRSISKDDFHIHHHKRKFRKSSEVILSTPTSPPPNEKIQIDLVDPLPTPTNSIPNISSLNPSSSTINAILELEHSPIIKNVNNITRYYRGELIEHLLNWPSTKIERETIRLSNEQIRFTTSQLTSLRTDLYLIRNRFEQNRFKLVKYRYQLFSQQYIINQLQLNDSD